MEEEKKSIRTLHDMYPFNELGIHNLASVENSLESLNVKLSYPKLLMKE